MRSSGSRAADAVEDPDKRGEGCRVDGAELCHLPVSARCAISVPRISEEGPVLVIDVPVEAEGMQELMHRSKQGVLLGRVQIIPDPDAPAPHFHDFIPIFRDCPSVPCEPDGFPPVFGPFRPVARGEFGKDLSFWNGLHRR